ncbi:membrane lipoprotein lipid attachment site-containing protein [Paucisalibacillus globulus]|uniref:membrane lipoprotein lipid attachment site-containing protein n=1 Tax=Paucisalibacillus globulus TaxID=351095 RepID=UPI0003F9F782|nr:membrane lipoprotein lipid attachment site-containing protein [Paucisalibacillus globulus]
MKKIIIILVLVFLAGCGGSDLTFTVENNPTYKDGEVTEIVLAAEDNEEVVTGLTLSGEIDLEDSEVIDVPFTDNGDGTYSGEASLPTSGEWILLVKNKDNEKVEHLIRLQVNEE